MTNFHLMSRSFCSASVALAVLTCLTSAGQAAEPPSLRILLVSGGCCHDYASQKGILKKGLEERLNVVVDQLYTPDGSTHPPLPILGHPDYAKGYDLIIHDECGADISDPATVESVLKPHRDGLPGVNLHCAMHSYRIGNPNQPVTPGTPHGLWFEYLGLQSSGHGAQAPIAIHFEKDKPVTRGLSDWTTMNEELYNNVHIFASAQPLAKGEQMTKRRDGTSTTSNVVVAWTNEYGPNKARVFSTTIGHNNATVGDARYLELVARGVLWATGHLKDDGTPGAGYGPKHP